PVLTLVTYQFLHGGFLHLLFNMLFVWVFADNVEDALGHGRFLLFWLVCGGIAGLAHAAVEPVSEVPMIGASGAVSGILGAYAVLYPRARILVLAFGVVPIRLPALLTILAWFLQDLLWATTGASGHEDVALWAHIGGFVAGAILVRPFRWRPVPAGPWR
ncbi:MAG: rhomboid family intramembrane serine protease, partial [Alphaproteobacteria bacterium]|nr:rhomboid family intramembrane serine protease [Alphaproteobacteria bacterium]